MRKYAFLAVLLTLVILANSMAFAETQLNITANASMAPQKSNISSIVDMLNITFMHNSTSGLNITMINFTYGSNTNNNATSANLSICVYNTTALLNCSSGWNGSIANVTLNFPMPSNGTNYTLIVAYNTTGVNRTLPLNASLFLFDNSSIVTSEVGTNITNSSFPLSSGITSIRIVDTRASITPRIVDTNVTNQTLRYYITALYNDSFENATISIPSNYTLIGIVNYTTPDGLQTACTLPACNATDNKITIKNASASSFDNITVYFNVNTSSNFTNTSYFNSTIDGTNVARINTTVADTGYLNVTTQNIINNVTNIRVVRGSAYVNGSDYWEFNFTLNFSAITIGLLQFKMTNWSSPITGGQLNLTNSTGGYLASMRGDIDNSTTNQFNVTNDYSPAQLRGEQGVYFNITSAGQQPTVALRMMIPAGVPIASDWWSTYNIVFRAYP